MRLKTLVDGLSDLTNDYIEGKLDCELIERFKLYLDEEKDFASFVQKSYKGKIALKKSYEVEAADDFEDKLAERIYALEEGQEQVRKCSD